MIVIKVELHSARTKDVTLLGTTIIHNVETSADGKLADYEVCVGRKTDAGDLGKTFRNPLRRGTVKAHHRLTENIWRLVLKGLMSAFPEEKP